MDTPTRILQQAEAFSRTCIVAELINLENCDGEEKFERLLGQLRKDNDLIKLGVNHEG